MKVRLSTILRANTICCFISIGLSSLLTGCGLFSKEATQPPMPLPQFKSQVDISQIWSRQIGNGQGDTWLNLRPVIQNHTIFAASDSGIVTAVNAQNGHTIWRTKLKQLITGGLAVHQEHLVLGLKNGHITALNTKTGAIEWNTYANGEVLSPPAINSTVIITQSTNGYLTAFNPSTGAKIWQHSVAIPALILRGLSSPVLHGIRVFSGFSNGEIIAWNTLNGTQIWENTIAVAKGGAGLEHMVDINTTPVFDSYGILYAIGYQGNITAIDMSNGQTIWSHQASSYQEMTLDNRTIFLTHSNSEVSAIDVSTGSSLWYQKKLLRRQLSGPNVYKKYVIAGDYQGYLHVMSRSDGDVVGRYALGSGIRVQPLVTDDRIYVYTNAGRLTALTIREKNV